MGHMLLILFCLSSPILAQNIQTLNILFINDAGNLIAEKSVGVALNYIKKNPRLGIHVEGFYSVKINGSNAKAILESLCHSYNKSIEDGKPPNLVLDTTITGVPSEAVKTFTAALSLPTVSASFGQKGDIRQWKYLDGEKLKYLIQISPPVDIIPEIIRRIVVKQKYLKRRNTL